MFDKKEKQQLYTVGEVAKLCNVSTKTLRYYDQLGLIKPDKVNEENGYRYYSRETLLMLPVIKYYKQMGFTLHEMSGVNQATSYFYHERNFNHKLKELDMEVQKIKEKHTAISDWYDLIQEGRMVIQNNLLDVSVKYFEKKNFGYVQQDFQYDYISSIINIPWTTLLEENQCDVTGPVILKYDSIENRVHRRLSQVTIMQEIIQGDTGNISCIERDAMLAVCTYHRGDFKNIEVTYKRLLEWIKQHHYIVEDVVYERYVVDYWTTKDTNQFVVELIIPISQTT